MQKINISPSLCFVTTVNTPKDRENGSKDGTLSITPTV